MRKVISNTTPIISLLKIGHLNLLRRLYGHIIVPHAVFKEIEAGKNKPFYANLQELEWVSIQPLQLPMAADFLTDLDRGEAEVIVLAREIAADLVIIDETLGRHYANHFGLAVTGTFGILARAKQAGYIPAVKPLLELLMEHGIWVGERVRKDILGMAGE